MGNDYVNRDEVLEEFASSLKAEGLKPKTIEGYSSDLRKTLPELTYPDYDALARTLEASLEQMASQESAKTSTINRAIASVSKLVNMLNQTQRFQGGITFPYTPPIKREPRTAISQENFQKIIKRIPSENYLYARDRLTCYLIYHLGLRESEVAKLDVRNLEVEAGKTFVWAGSREQKRKLEIDEETATELENYRTLYSKAAEKKGLPPLEKGSLLRNRSGRRIDVRSIRRNITEWMSEAGVNATLLDLRYGYAKTQLNRTDKEVKPKDLATQMGAGKNFAYTLRKLLR